MPMRLLLLPQDAAHRLAFAVWHFLYDHCRSAWLHGLFPVDQHGCEIPVRRAQQAAAKAGERAERLRSADGS